MKHSKSIEDFIHAVNMLHVLTFKCLLFPSMLIYMLKRIRMSYAHGVMLFNDI